MADVASQDTTSLGSATAPRETRPPRAADLVGCPVCDAVYHLPSDPDTKATRCARCGYELTYGAQSAITQVVSLSFTNVMLLIMVLFLPFLQVRVGSIQNNATVIDVVLGFSSGIMVPLAVLVLGFILLLPLCRFVLLIYALGPIVLKRPNLPHAAGALYHAFALKPWAMAEIFMVGVVVALVKLVDLAEIGIGPAFWMFGALVVLSTYKEMLMSRHTLWTALSCNH